MAKIKNLAAAIAREPESAGTKIERKGLNGSDEDQASATPQTAGASPKNKSPLAEPFPPDAAMRGQWAAKHLAQPTDRENNHAAQTRAK